MEHRAGNRRAQMTRRMIREALAELLREKPLGKVSVSELCERADVNRTTFYKHYDTQADVLREIGELAVAGVLDAARAPGAGSAQPSLQDQVTGICRHLKAHEEDARFMLAHFTADDDLVKSLLTNRVMSGQVGYRKDIPGYDESTERLLDEFVIHAVYSLIRCWLLEGVNKAPEDIGALAAEIAGHGWVAPA